MGINAVAPRHIIVVQWYLRHYFVLLEGNYILDAHVAAMRPEL